MCRRGEPGRRSYGSAFSKLKHYSTRGKTTFLVIHLNGEVFLAVVQFSPGTFQIEPHILEFSETVKTGFVRFPEPLNYDEAVRWLLNRTSRKLPSSCELPLPTRSNSRSNRSEGNCDRLIDWMFPTTAVFDMLTRSLRGKQSIDANGLWNLSDSLGTTLCRVYDTRRVFIVSERLAQCLVVRPPQLSCSRLFQ